MELLRGKSYALYDSQIKRLEDEAHRLKKKSASILLREIIDGYFAKEKRPKEKS